MDSKLFNLGFDPIFLMAILLAIAVVGLIISIIANIRTVKLWHRYDRFMRGKDAETLEELINQLVLEFEALKERQESLDEKMKDVLADLKGNVKKTAVRKYNAFKDVGGKLSFSLVMLDGENNGIILTCIHANGPSFTYIKEIIGGESYVSLSIEEQEALNEAKEYGWYE